MSNAAKLPALLAAAIAGCAIGFGALPAAAQATPDSDNGRYKFSPTIDGGVLRLDTRTGSVSNCSQRGTAGWACYAVPDERDAVDAEIGRLQADNERLKGELRKRDVADAGSKTDV